MATKTLRPTHGSTLGHSLSSGSSPAELLNETTQDGDATYMYHDITGTSDTTKTTTINLGTPFSGTNYNVTALRVYAVARVTNTDGSRSMTLTCIVNDQNYSSASPVSLGSSYSSGSMSDSSAVNAINQSLQTGSVPTIKVAVKTTGKKSRSKDDDFQIRVTQLYVEIDYNEIVQPTTAIYLKENGSWKQYNEVYKKVNGAWVLQQSLSGVFDTNANYVRMN